MYYLQSRYYNPEVGRFINADAYTSTGQGIIGNNMFAYCLNNPVMGYDPTGNWDWGWEDQAALGAAVFLTGLALLLSAPTGGASLAFGALMLNASTAVSAGSAMAIAGTVMVGTAIAASACESSNKGRSNGKDYQKARSNKQANEWANKVGYDGAEQLKEDIVGVGNGSKFNLAVNRATRELILIAIKTAIELSTGLYLP